MAHALKQAPFLSTFQCLGERCPDTCCKGWGMQLDQETRSVYETKAPELLTAVDTGEAEWIMKRDPATDYCVKFEDGLCGIHKTYGTDFLGDACHFFPRITRKLGSIATMSAALSCPEITRLALQQEHAFPLEDTVVERLPNGIKNYLPEKLSEEEALSIHESFLACSFDPGQKAERILTRLLSIAYSLEQVDASTWPKALPFYWQYADGRLPELQAMHEDPFNLLHALFGLIVASKKTNRPFLEKTLHEMEMALKVKLNPETVSIATTPESFPAWQQMQANWSVCEEMMQPVLKRWVTMQLSMALFPFAGLGHSLSERAAIIGVRFATVKLALMAHVTLTGGIPTAEETIRIVQSLARFMDHLADPTLSLAIYRETGWLQVGRMRGLVGDISA